MKEKIKLFSLASMGILSALILIYVVAKYLFPVMMPFVIAVIVASSAASMANKIADKIKLPKKTVRLAASLLLATLFISFVAIIVWQTSSALWRFFSDIDDDSRIYSMLNAIFSIEIPLLGNLPPELADRISDAIGRLVSGGMSLITGWVTNLAAALPQVFLFLVVTLISLTYFSVDYDKICEFARSMLPKRALEIVRRLRATVVTVVKKYISSYLLILLITYFVMLIGLWILRVDHAPVIAMFIALLDILPVIGVGTVLLPWGIIEIVMGNRMLGIGLIALFAINAVIRQMSEPKIVGKSLDLHPIITLMMIYVGYSLFGIAGMLILPVIAVSISAILKGNDAAEIT